MTYRFSQSSMDKMAGVDHKLVKVAKRAIELSKVDFRITEGLRTLSRQRELVAKGLSQTLNSKHLTGKALDVVALVDGKVSWDMTHYFTIADAFREASLELNIPIRWGGCWDELGKFSTAKDAYSIYISLRRKLGKRAFIDGPHFELPN